MNFSLLLLVEAQTCSENARQMGQNLAALFRILFIQSQFKFSHDYSAFLHTTFIIHEMKVNYHYRLSHLWFILKTSNGLQFEVPFLNQFLIFPRGDLSISSV